MTETHAELKRQFNHLQRDNTETHQKLKKKETYIKALEKNMTTIERKLDKMQDKFRSMKKAMRVADGDKQLLAFYMIEIGRMERLFDNTQEQLRLNKPVDNGSKKKGKKSKVKKVSE
jgi:wobble nucleotide-excising tRNase